MNAAAKFTHHELAATFPGAKANADGSYHVQCMVHADPVGSLTISQGDKQPVIVKCFAGCDQALLWQKCLERMAGRIPHTTPAASGMPPTPANTAVATTKKSAAWLSILPAPCEPDNFNHRDFPGIAPTLIYRYCAINGAVNFYNCRFEFPHGSALYAEHGRKTHRPYTYQQNVNSGNKKWRWAAPESGKRTPYRLETLTGAPDDTMIMISEGEKAANAAATLATEIVHLSWWGGASNWSHTDWTVIAGRSVWLVPDADTAGISAMDKLKSYLESLGCTVKYAREVVAALAAMGAPEKKGFDAADALELGWNHDDFIRFLDIASTIPASVTASLSAPVTTTGTADAIPPTFAADIKRAINSGWPFIALGYNRDIYYYLSKESKQIHDLSASAHKDLNLLSICSNPTFWIGFAPTESGKVDWKKCAAKMMEACKDQGLYFSDFARGRGAWFDRDSAGHGHAVLHLGNRIVVDGVECDILTRPGKFVYEFARPMDGPGNIKMTDAEGAQICELANQFSFDRQIFSCFLVGWVVLAPICGALDWRPHIWIVGAAGTGKTTLLEHFLKALIGNMVLVVQGSSTEAGVRQTLGHDAIPVIFDESESEDEKGRSRISMILQLIRQSSSETAAETVKGGAGGKAQSYHIRSMFALSSINTALSRAADMARVTVLSLHRSDNDWTALQRRLAEITPDTSRRLIARTVSLIPVIRRNARLLATEMVKSAGLTQRFGDQYGALLAGWHSLRSAEELTHDEAAAIVSQYANDFVVQASDVEADEDQCLTHLLQQIVRVDGNSGAPVSVSIAELILIVSKGHHGIGVSFDLADAVLKRFGIIAHPFTVLIARSHSKLRELFRNTTWQAGWHRYLLRLPGASVPATKSGGEAKHRFGNTSPIRCIEIPISLVEGGESTEAVESDAIGF